MRTLLLTERELHRVISILVENKRLDFLREKFSNVTKKEFDAAASIDPTSNNKYTQWLLTQKAWQLTNFYKDNIKKFLKEFDKQGVRNKLDEKDINKYRIDDFYNVMTKLDRDIKADRFTSKPEILNKTKIGETENYVAYKPTTYWHSCKIGTNTKWCTSSTTSGRGHFKTYTQDGGELLIFVNKNDETQKYQYSTKKREFKNENNRSAKKPDEIKKFIGEYYNIDLEALEDIENDLLRAFIEFHNDGTNNVDDYNMMREGDNYIEVEVDGEEWSVWSSIESVEDYAIDVIEENLENGHYPLNELIDRYGTINDYIIRDFAEWEASNVIEDWDVDELEEYLGQDELEEYNKLLEIDEDKAEEYIDSLRDSGSILWDNLYTHFYENIENDPFVYFMDDLGYSASDLIDNNWVNINYRQIATDWAPEEWPYAVAHYDNTYEELADGIITYRTN